MTLEFVEISPSIGVFLPTPLNYRGIQESPNLWWTPIPQGILFKRLFSSAQAGIQLEQSLLATDKILL